MLAAVQNEQILHFHLQKDINLDVSIVKNAKGNVKTAAFSPLSQTPPTSFAALCCYMPLRHGHSHPSRVSHSPVPHPPPCHCRPLLHRPYVLHVVSPDARPLASGIQLPLASSLWNPNCIGF